MSRPQDIPLPVCLSAVWSPGPTPNTEAPAGEAGPGQTLHRPPPCTGAQSRVGSDMKGEGAAARRGQATARPGHPDQSRGHSRDSPAGALPLLTVSLLFLAEGKKQSPTPSSVPLHSG